MTPSPSTDPLQVIFKIDAFSTKSKNSKSKSPTSNTSKTCKSHNSKTNTMFKFSPLNEIISTITKNINFKSENLKNTVKKKSIKSVISTWSLSDWTKRQSSKLESWDKKRKDLKAIWLMKKANTEKKCKASSLSSTTTFIQKLKISRNNTWTKLRLLITRTPNWRKLSTLKILKFKAFLPKIKRSNIITKILTLYSKTKMKIWKIRWSSRSTSTIWRLKILNKSLTAWETLNLLFSRMPTRINLISSIEKSISFKKLLMTEPERWKISLLKETKWEMIKKMKLSTVRLNSKLKSTKIRTSSSGMKKNLKTVTLSTRPKKKNSKPQKPTTKVKSEHLLPKRIPWTAFCKARLTSCTDPGLNSLLISKSSMPQSRNLRAMWPTCKMTLKDKPERAAQ